MSKNQYMSEGQRASSQIKTSDKDNPLVSVITVVYNGEKYLEQTILSVINQTYANVEYIIIDGSSSDNTIEIIKNYASKIDLWISEPDKGIYDAMNKGIAMSKGVLIGIINSDDWYEPNAISDIVKAYMSDNESAIFYGLHRLWDIKGVLGIIGYTDLFLNTGMISHPTCFIKKDAYDKYGMYNTKYRISADYELMMRYKSIGLKFKFLEIILANFRNCGISNKLRKRILFETNEIKRSYSIISWFQLSVYKVSFSIKTFLKID